MRNKVAVITYGSFDLLHHGHVRLLNRCKALGDHLSVFVSSDEFHSVVKGKDREQGFDERFTAVAKLGVADEMGIEESWEQRLSDVTKLQAKGYHVVFAVGADWVGKFDYVEYTGATVVYFPRTPGISSTEKRNELRGDGE